MDVVYNLINVKHFNDYTHEEKLELKKQGRPMPDFIIEAKSVSRGKSYNRRCYSKDIYSKNDWICGCNRKNAFFCFPCLLYGAERMWTVWSEEGVTSLTHMGQCMKRHENSKKTY